MKAVLVSFFDTNNIGDLLISDQLYKKTNIYFDKVYKFNYLDGKAQSEGTNLEIDAFQSSNVSRKRSLKSDISKFLEKSKLLSLNYFYLSKIQKFQLDDFEEKIKESEALIIGGGNMIFDMYKRTLGASRFDQYVSIAKKNNKPVFATSLGIGPFQTSFQLEQASKALRKCDYVTFRDNESYKLFMKDEKNSHSNASVAVDPVFSLPKVVVSHSEQRNIIGVNIINNPVYSNKEIYSKVIEGYVLLIKRLNEKYNNKIVLFSTETRDYEVIKDVYKQLNDTKMVTVEYIANTNQLFELYGKLNLLIGTRMHSMIIAYTQYIPIIGLSWQPKVKAMFDVLNDNESCFKLLNLITDIEKITSLSEKKMNESQMVIEENLNRVLKKEIINDNIYKSLVSNIKK